MSDEIPASDDINFADEMQQLANQVDGSKPSAALSKAAAASSRTDRSDLLLSVGEMVRPLAIDLDQIKRAGSDNNLLLTALGKSLNAQRSIPQSLEAMAAQMQRLGSVESANQKLFDALHAELKTYKDNFLFDALQKPFIRDLVTLFDDFSAVHLQTGQRLAEVREAGTGGDELAFLERIYGNLENNLHHLLEVFLRMNVTISQTAAGAPIDKKVHRTVAVAPAEGPADDSLIERSVKPGFFWQERTVRAEEVVVRRWTPAAPGPAENEAARETVLIDPAAEGNRADLEGSPL